VRDRNVLTIQDFVGENCHSGALLDLSGLSIWR
jgi:hypothetical protein